MRYLRQAACCRLQPRMPAGTPAAASMSREGTPMARHATSFALLVAAALLVASGVAQAAADPQTDEQKTLYAMGRLIADRFRPLDLDESQVAMVQAGFAEALLGQDSRVDIETFGPKIQELLNSRSEQVMAREVKAGEEFCTKAAAEPGAIKTASGAIYRELSAGSGAQPGPTDRVKINYHGTLRDGTVFDTTRREGAQPAEFALNGVIKCFSEGVQQMKVGGKARLTCPADTAYGERGSPPLIRPGATLVFELELLDIVGAPAAPATPTP